MLGSEAKSASGRCAPNRSDRYDVLLLRSLNGRFGKEFSVFQNVMSRGKIRTELYDELCKRDFTGSNEVGMPQG